MPELEKVIQDIQRSGPNNMPHANFRIYMTSMPCDHFPASILQNSLKLTTEPPKGIRANSRKTFNEFNADILEHPKPRYWKRLLFGLACKFIISNISFPCDDPGKKKIRSSWVQRQI